MIKPKIEGIRTVTNQTVAEVECISNDDTIISLEASVGVKQNPNITFDHPWGAGNGINLADFKDGYTVDSNGNIQTMPGEIATIQPIYIEPNTQYSFFAADNCICSYAVLGNSGVIRYVRTLYSGSQLNVSNGSALYVSVRGYSGSPVYVYNAYAMIVKGTVIPEEYRPYTNPWLFIQHNKMNIVVSPTADAADGTSYSFDLGTNLYGYKATINDDGTGTVSEEMVAYTFGNFQWNFVLYNSSYGLMYGQPRVKEMINAISPVVCEIYETSNATDPSQMEDKTIAALDDGRVVIKDTNFTNATIAFRSINRQIEYGYKIAYVPQTKDEYTLSNVTTIPLLNGVNYVFAKSLKNQTLLLDMMIDKMNYYGTISPMTYFNHILDGNRSHARMIFPVQNITINDDDISVSGGLTLTTSANPDEDLQFGTTVCTEVSASLLNSSKFIGFDWTEEFRLDFGLDIEGETNWVTVGYFAGQRPQKLFSVDIITFTAYDRMKKLEVPADDVLSVFPFGQASGATLYDLLFALCNHVGIGVPNNYLKAFEGDTTDISRKIMTNPFYEGTTCREIVQQIAELTGHYATVDEDGNILFKINKFRSEVMDYTLYTENCFSIDIAEQTTQGVDLVQIIDSENHNLDRVYPTGVSGETYYLINNRIFPYLENVSQGSGLTGEGCYANARSNMTIDNYYGAYYPGKVSTIGNWLMQIGDVIHVSYENKYTQQTVDCIFPVMFRQLKWNGACRDTLEAVGKTNRSIPNELKNFDEAAYANKRINNVEDRVDDLETNWTSVKTSSASGKGVTAYVSKWGKAVTVRVSGSLTSAYTNGNTLLTLPSGYRPSNEIRTYIFRGSNTTTQVFQARITTGGILSIYQDLPSGAGLYGFVTFLQS